MGRQGRLKHLSGRLGGISTRRLDRAGVRLFLDPDKRVARQGRQHRTRTR